MYDVIAVHGHLFDMKGGLTDEGKGRVELAVDLYNQGEASHIIMGTGPAKYLDGTRPAEDTRKLCDLMADHARTLGVPDRVLKTEPISTDTVGGIWFVKQLHAAPNNWNRVLNVSSAYQGPRIVAISHQVLGPAYTQDFAGFDAPITPEQMALESQNLLMFYNQFGDLAPEDDRAFEERLWSAHGLYNKWPAERRKIFFND